MTHRSTIALVIGLFAENAHCSLADEKVKGKASNSRPFLNAEDARFWLENMVWHHRFSDEEIASATGMKPAEISDLKRKFEIDASTKPARRASEGLLVRPYPGGRHPRIGFLEGAIDPQRETKVSVFLPWNEAGYLVADVPEAIWWNVNGQRELLYLAHTHVPTTWTKRNVTLDPLEWTRLKNGRLRMERKLPNGVEFGTEVTPGKDGVKLRMWLANGTDQKLSGLRVQNCIMLKAAKGFAKQTNDNKVFKSPYAACRAENSDRWIITAWMPCERAWGNARCPCLHSDPQFPDCAPGKTVELKGWISFFEGKDIDQEFQRLDALKWNRDD